MTQSIRSLGIAIFLIIISVASLQAKDDPADRSWLEGLSLVELETDDTASLHRALALIQSRGGRIGIVSPPSLLIGWIPYELRDELAGEAGIRDIYVSEVLPGDVEIRDRQTQHMVQSFNAMARGDYQEKMRRRMAAAPAQQEWPDKEHGDALLPDPIDKEAYLQNLIDNGFDVQQLADRAILYGSNSLYMTGTSTVTLIFVESDGSGADPNTYTWTDQHVQDYIDGVNAGLLWWSDQANNYSGCWAAFFVRYFPPTDSRCQQWREMVLHPSGDVASMASEIMSNFGYTSGTHFSKTDAFNTAQRATYGTDWAYTAYVAYNPPPAPAELTNGTSAFAYFGGPYTFLLYRSYGWAIDQVFPHESGHIYRACDEYLSSGCTCAETCSNGVLNGNCAACGGGPCMMKSNSFVVCAYTDDHLGWQQNPCAPAPLTPPTTSTIFPASAVQGTELDVAIAGSDYLYGAFADLGAGITITSTTLAGNDSLYLTIQIDNDAVPGPRDVTVSNRDLQTGVLPAGFSVVQSTRHYVSPSGGNIYPYITPADAATAFANALAAAGDGDSVLVDTTTIALATVSVTENVWLVGAWDPSFTSRDPVGARTRLQMVNNISFVSGGSAGMDGFVVEDGQGTAAINPQAGSYGGAVRVELTTATIRNCEIRNCDAAASGFGGGGGVAVYQGTLHIEDSYIHGNTATQGGGVFMHTSSGSITNTTITGNDITQFTGTPEGGGVYIEGCTGVSLVDNTIEGNIGANRGGGVTVRSSTGVTIDGGSISNHTTASNGAALLASTSDISVDGVTFDHNAGFLGGAVASDTCDVGFTHCKFSWNTGIIGAGLYAVAGTCTTSHNLFVGNAAASSGGGLYLVNLAGGEVTGNTMDRNSGPGGAGAMTIAGSTIEVFNNIVTNSTGIGVQCSGTPAVLSYNDVWNSSGADYDGCTGGTGAISADPAFADTSGCDYHLGAHSPAIDTGRPGASYDDPDGSPGDMGRYGAHTFVMDQPEYVKNLTAQIEGGNVVLRWDTNPEADIAQYAVYCDTVTGFAPGAGNFIAFAAAPDTSVDLGAPTDTSYYRVAALDTSGYAGGYSGEASISPPTGATTAVRFANRLYQNVPNPFNPVTTIGFELAAAADVSLVVYDVAGRVVKRLVAERRRQGPHAVEWNGRNEQGQSVSSGVYFYRLTTDRFSTTRKMVLLK